MTTRLTLAVACVLSIGSVRGQQTFEVVSVKPSAPNSHTETRRWPGGRFTATAVTLRALIQRAWELQDFQILGGPKWMDSDPYDIEAKSASPVTSLSPLIQNLLAERFALKTHFETRELPMYSLTVAKGGLRLARNTSDQGPQWSLGRGTLTGEKISMEMLASDLLQHTLRQPVDDKTGVAGEYDLKLEWAPDETIATDLVDQPSFFTAIREQWGLQLEHHKGPVKVLIVDAAEKPQPN